MKIYTIPLKIINVEELYITTYKSNRKQIRKSNGLLSSETQFSILIRGYYSAMGKYNELTYEQLKQARKFFKDHTSHEVILKITYLQYNPNFFSKFYYKLKQLIIKLCNKNNL